MFSISLDNAASADPGILVEVHPDFIVLSTGTFHPDYIVPRTSSDLAVSLAVQVSEECDENAARRETYCSIFAALENVAETFSFDTNQLLG